MYIYVYSKQTRLFFQCCVHTYKIMVGTINNINFVDTHHNGLDKFNCFLTIKLNIRKIRALCAFRGTVLEAPRVLHSQKSYLC